MGKIKEFAKNVTTKVKDNVKYLLARDAREKLNSFMIWIIVVSIVGFVVLASLAAMVIWLIATNNVGRIDKHNVYCVYGGILGLAIFDIILLITWLTIMILTVIVSRKAEKPIDSKKLNIMYLTLLSVFVGLGILVIIFFFLWAGGYFVDEQKHAWAVTIIVFEAIRAGILLTVFVTALRYRIILRRFFKNTKPIIQK